MTKIQKTFLALLATATAFSASAEGSKEGNFYLGAGLGGFIQSKPSHPLTSVNPLIQEIYNSSGINPTLSSKSKRPGIAFDTAISVGYYITDSFRGEAVFVKPFLNKSKFTTSATYNDKTVNVLEGYTKLHLYSLQLRGLYDLIDITDIGKLYAGAGIGLTNLQGKVTASTTQNTIDDAGFQYTYSAKFKNSYNLAWVLVAGAEFDVADNTKLGLEYNYSDHGKTKFKNKSTSPKIAVRGHSILAKLRFDI